MHIDTRVCLCMYEYKCVVAVVCFIDRVEEPHYAGSSSLLIAVCEWSLKPVKKNWVGHSEHNSAHHATTTG